MKLLLTFFFLLLITTKQSFGQNVDTEIQSKWLNLNLILTKRADKFLALSNDLIKADTSKEVLFIEAKFIASELSEYLSTCLKPIEAKTIKIVSIKNDNLTKVLERIMKLMADGKEETKILPLFFIYMPQITGIEKRLEIAKLKYNKACKANKRKDLLFLNPSPKKEVKL